MIYEDAYVAHVQAHETRYGTNGVDLFLPGRAAIWCKSRAQAKVIAASYGCEIYSGRAKAAPSRSITKIYGAKASSDPDFGPSFYRMYKKSA